MAADDDPPVRQRPSRRSFLSVAGRAAGIGSVSGVSGCLSLLGDDTVTVGYDPSFRTVQGPVLVEEGYLDEVDASVEAVDYGDEDGRLEDDLTAGEVQVALMTADDAAIAADSAVSARITAANTVDDCVLLGGEAFAGLWADHGPEAFERFREQHDRPFELVSVLPGLDGTLAGFWLDAAGVPDDAVTRDFDAYSAPVIRQRWQDGAVDGAFVSPVLATELSASAEGLQPVADAGSQDPTQPGGVVAMTESFLDDRPGVARSIVRKHATATGFVRDRPGDAASILATEAEDLVAADIAERALESRAASVVADPRRITAGMEPLLDLLADIDVVDGDTTVEDVVDASYYADAVGA